jgi:hypothetical protein
MATYNFTFLIPSSDLTSISLNSSVTKKYQVATAYANGNVVSSASNNQVSATITMLDVDVNDVRLSTLGMILSFQDNNVAFDSKFTKAGTSTTSAVVSSQVGGNTPASLINNPITFNFSIVVDTNSNPYLQVIGTMTTTIPLYGKFWAKNVNPGKALTGVISSFNKYVFPSDLGTSNTTHVYYINGVNPNPRIGALNIIYPVNYTASKPLINDDVIMQNKTASFNSLEIVGTTTILPRSASAPYIYTGLSQQVNNKFSSGNINIIYKLPPSIRKQAN